jgi:hypothetical protein
MKNFFADFQIRNQKAPTAPLRLLALLFKNKMEEL